MSKCEDELHDWAYLKMSIYESSNSEDRFYRICNDCKLIFEINEEEYIDNAFINSEEMYFSYN